MKDNFERCLAHTLKWEGGYSHHPDDPGGATMRGVTQATYDTWRSSQRKRKRPVRQLEGDELRAIYRDYYWDACGCDTLSSGLDLCVFDAGVNSGVARAKAWLREADTIDTYTARRMAFVQGLRTWRVFGRGWKRRIDGIRTEALRMEGTSVHDDIPDVTLHAGLRGDAVRSLQKRLRALGYPAGAIDGIFGEQTFRAVLLFQEEHELAGDKGVWLAEYEAVLNNAAPMLPKRRQATHKNLERLGDKPVQRMNLLQRIFAWLFGASAVAQFSEQASVVEGLGAAREMLEPLQGLLSWASSNKWMLAAAGAVALIMVVRSLRARHVQAYRHFDYQGDFKDARTEEAV